MAKNDATNVAIKVSGVHKKFKIYYDKGSSLKEKLLFSKRRRYEDRWVLRGIDVEVKQGEAIGLVGENGCGKSTLLKMLSRIMYPDKGTIEVNGRVSSLIELGAGFHPDMSGRENIYTNAAIFGLTHKEIDERLDDIIEFSELEEYIDNPVRTYSSGMYMRLAFSVAINVDADVLLIDEILAVGDANFQAKCFKHLRKLKAKGVTIIIVTHDTTTVEKFCDRAYWIESGYIKSEGDSKTVVDEYLHFMNDKLYDTMQRSETSVEKSEKSEPEDASDSDEIPATDCGANHFGVRHIEITKGGFIDAAGNYTKLLKEGDDAVLQIEYRVNTPIDSYIFGMGIYTLENKCIYGTNTMLDGYRIDDLGEAGNTGRIRFFIKDNFLMTGTYILQLAIVDGNNIPEDYYHNYDIFDVVSKSRAIGTCLFKHDWQID